mmetsp:Transcript_20789/g.33386  ORF Transcript_20789/g.33386 Transcript_20789/m.33386 type:complete len:444 (-) Transcript_20789:316-1647(-)
MYDIPRVAGKTHRAPNESTANCLRDEERPETPPHIRRFRKTNYSEPGSRVVHPGAQDDVKALNDGRIFGVRDTAAESDHIQDVWGQPGANSEYASLKKQMAEQIYQTTKREPLGKVYSRPGHQLPERFGPQGGTPFGMASAKGVSAKELLYPDEGYEGLAYLNKAQYKTSHGAYDPGEQRRRGYDWGAQGPEARTFGRAGITVLAMNGNSHSVAAALRGEDEQGRTAPAKVTAKRVEDYKGLSDTLGRARNLGGGPRGGAAADPNVVYGMPTLPVGGEDAKSAIEGDYSYAEQMPDPDLGRSCMPGFRNVTTEARAFGVPSVRLDVAAPARRSVADHQNYGDDVNAGFLLRAGEFSSMGIQDGAFFEPRPRAQLEALVRGARLAEGIADDELDALWAEASAAHGGQRAALRAYQLALGDYAEARDAGNLGRWRQDRGLPLEAK